MKIKFVKFLDGIVKWINNFVISDPVTNHQPVISHLIQHLKNMKTLKRVQGDSSSTSVNSTNSYSVMLNSFQHRTGDDEDITSKDMETLSQAQGDGMGIKSGVSNNQPTLAQQPFAKRISRCEASKLKRAAFSLIELMISLITISIIAAAFTPVITKKLSASSITVGSMGSSGSGSSGGGYADSGIEESTGDCKLTYESYCLYCTLQSCSEGQYVDINSCSCRNCTDRFGENCTACSQTQCLECADGNKMSDAASNPACVAGGTFTCPTDGNFFEITFNSGLTNEYKLCVTKYNMGDIPGITGQIDSSVITLKSASSSDSSSSRCDTSANKCCWTGSTADPSYCDSTNSTSYSGCKRTVCEWDAAVEICNSFNLNDVQWRLPTIDELAYFGSHTIGQGNSGLMLCERYSGYSSARCYIVKYCWGSYDSNCDPYHVWSGTEVSGGTNAYSYYLYQGSWNGPNSDTKACPFSVRCVVAYDKNGDLL